MTARQVLRLALALAAAALVAFLIYSAIRPIIGIFRQREADARAGQEQAIDDAVGRGLEAEGTANLARSESSDARQVIIIRESAHALELEARTDPTEIPPMPDSVRSRIERGDLSLCSSGVECRAASPAAPPVDP